MNRLARTKPKAPTALSHAAVAGSGRKPLYLAMAVASFFSGAALAEEAATVLAPVSVVGTPDLSGLPAQTDRAGTATDFRVSQEGMGTFGAAGGANAYSLVSGLPSVKVQLLDPYGMTNKIGGNKGMRVRGIAAWHGANGTVDGLNLSGIGPGAGYLSIFDMENLAGASLVQGPVPPDRPNFFTVSGALDSQLAWPEAEATRDVSVSAGSFDFRRLFARVDSGNFAGESRVSFSASDTSSDLWRGPGESKRNNYQLAASTRAGDVNLRFMAVSSQIDQHNYRPLTAAQAADLDRNYKLGYDAVASAASPQTYYNYNKQSFTETGYVAEGDYRFSADTRLVVKAYYLNEDGWSMDAVTVGAANRVRRWIMDHDSYGVTGEVQTRLGLTDLKLGYAWSSLEPPGPPNAQKLYTPTTTGLTFAAATSNTTTLNKGWITLSEITDRHQFQNYYVSGSREWGDTRVQGGLRYMREILPSFAEHNKIGVGDVSYDSAIKSSPVLISVKGPTISEVLPYLGVSHALSSAVELKASAGRLYGAPSFDIWNSSAKTQTQARAQQLWDSLKGETDDAVDVSLRFNLGKVYVEPTLYYAKVSNKSVNTYDPAVNLTYARNIGNGYTQGAQVAWGWTPTDPWTIFGSAAYNKAVFSENIQTGAATTLKVSGLQFPDTPRRTLTVGTTWQAAGFTATPILRYMGERYDDSVHTNRVGGFSTVDLTLGYGQKATWGKLDYSVSVMNLFDKRYVGLIDSGDLQTGNVNYYPGAPRTLIAKLALKF